MPVDNITGQHWVGANELVMRGNTEFVRISPTSSHDWERGGAVGTVSNNRGVRGWDWDIPENNIYIPLTEVVGYRIFRLTP